MESPPKVKRSTHVITIQPNETVLTAFPYGPHSSLLDFLKGEPKVLGAIQILLALIIAGVGIIFAFNYLNFSQSFPLVFFTGYPFWGAFIFFITGYLTGINNKEKCLGQGVTAMNVISSLVAVAGITFTIISYRYQHKYCQTPSVEGICVIGRILFNGILSVLLIISIVELSISVTIVSFRSKCWTKSNEIVFFLPTDVTQDSEFSVPEENAVIQFELQEESSSEDSITNIQPIFFGGYTFFKLRVLRNPLAFQRFGKRGSDSYYTSVSVPDEQEKSIPPPLKLYEEEVELKPLPPTLEKRPSENIMHPEQLTDEDLKSAILQSPKRQTQLLQTQALPLQVFPPRSLKQLKVLPPQDLPSQALPAQTLPVQALLSEAPTSHVTQSHGLTSEDMPSQDIPSQDKQSQDMPSQDTQSLDISSQYPSFQDMLSQNTPSQDMPSQNILYPVQVLPAQTMLFEAPTLHAAQSPNIQHLDQKLPDLQLQNIQPQDQQFTHVSYQDIKSEVMLLTQEWKSVEKLQGKKFPKRHSLDRQSKGGQSPKQHSLGRQRKGLQSPKRKSLNLQIQDQQSPKRKSLDQHIRSWLFPKRHSLDKQVCVKQTTQQPPDQPAEDQLTQGEQSLKQQSQNVQGEDQQGKEELSPKEQSKDGKDKDQQADKKQSSKKQTQHQQAEERQVQEEKFPKQLCQDCQSKIHEYQDRQPPRKQSPDWKTQQSQGWRNKDCKAQEWQFEMQHSLNWGSQGWQTQDLLQKESLKQKALFQEAQMVHAITRHHLVPQLQDILFQNNQYEDMDQQDFQSTGVQEEDMQIDTMQTRDIKPRDMKSQYQNPSDLQSEDTKPDFRSSSCQSSIQDTYFTYLSNIDSEKDVQQNISTCSTSYKEDPSLTSTSCSPKDQQQSEDSD
ncbi:PREDICTED: membrane-spanning 4-domains subfamily A member 14 [Ceratotherium simum simum]|uniref:Membrane-spanning 4-domains subfamily A member 14 n=1 Tax=Ceratotherium simum simum TaxID=73337 RepID=A0ABM0I0P9_CERSS|nr:PREDICTED: membrane-spanning 4-domains subfamily A member 14 [Ceratotherium simum simum]